MLRISLLLVLLSIPYIQAKDDQSQEEGYKACGQNSKARELARLIINDRDQKRPVLKCDDLLSIIAANKAQEMAKEGKVSHDGPGGTPDLRLLKAGYPLALPSGVLGDNHVESIMGGTVHAEGALDYFRNSYAHRIHLFGEHPFYLEQYEIGVGYAEEWFSPHVNYWVVYIAKPDRPELKYDDQQLDKDIKQLGIYKK